MKNNIIYSFSGTGNCLAAAKQIAKHIDMQVAHITSELIESKPEVICDFCTLVVPSYAYGLPLSVKKFIENATFKVNYFAVITTFGSKPGGCAPEAVRLLKKKNQKVHFVSGTLSVENYVHVFGFAKDEKLEKLLLGQTRNIDDIIGLLQKRTQNQAKLFRPFSRFVSCLFRVFKPLIVKGYKVTNNCNSCEICRKICSANAITMKDKNGKQTPKFSGKKCDLCQSCLQACPQKAIKYMRVKPEGKRYLHPDIKINELIKRD